MARNSTAAKRTSNPLPVKTREQYLQLAQQFRGLAAAAPTEEAGRGLIERGIGYEQKALESPAEGELHY
jgi:hypothetical protein